MAKKQSKLAVAHWGEHCNGGGERVAWELGRQLDCPVYVGRRDTAIEPDDVDIREIDHNRVTRRLVDQGGVGQMLGYQLAWELPGLEEYDTIVTSGNEPLAYVPQRDDQVWVHYVHHTSRQATDRLSSMHDKQGRLRPLLEPVEQAVRKVERHVYASYARKPDLLVANSPVIKRRIQRYWGIPAQDIRVVYPPVPVDQYSRTYAPTSGRYVTVSRLDGHKRIDEIVRAFNQTSHELVIAGDGSERDRLERLADDNVSLAGYVSEQRKRDLLASARAFVFNAEREDFGLAPVEALASGTPVIGVREGMTQHQVRDGETGITYDRGSLGDAIDRFERDGVAFSERDLEAYAEQFSTRAFVGGIKDAISEARERARIDVQLSSPHAMEVGDD